MPVTSPPARSDGQNARTLTPHHGFARALRVTAAVAAVGLVAGGAAACGTSSAAGGGGGGGGASDSVVKIGAVYSVSGDLAVYGNDIINGLKFYATYTNAHGGIDGHKVEIDLKDDQSTATVGETVMRELIADNSVVATTGAELPAESELLSRVAEAEKIPYLADILSLPDSYYNSLKYTYRASCWSDTATVKAVLEQLKATGAKKITVLYPLDAGGQPGFTTAQQLAPQLGLTVTGINYPAGTANASVYALKAIQTHPDAFLAWDQDTPTELGLVVKDLRANGATQPIGAPEGASSPVFTQATGAGISGVYYWAGSSPTALPAQFTAVGTAMTKAGLKPDDYMFGGYAIGQSIGAAAKIVLDKKEALNRTTVNAAMETLSNVPTIYGPVTYTPQNHAEPLSVVPVFEHKNGTIVRANA
jgi:branched-chain amino acid transport system substrate-binding protein